MSKKRMIIVLVFIALFVICSAITLRADYLEIKEIGEEYTQIFAQNLKYKYITMGVNFVILFFAIYITTRGIKKGLKKFFEEEKKEFPKLPNKSIALIASVIISLITSGIITEKLILAHNSSLFALPEADPIFGQDVRLLYVPKAIYRINNYIFYIYSNCTYNLFSCILYNCF